MLPDWINYVPITDSYQTNLDPLECKRCRYVWYPRIDYYGEIKINTCPKCKSKLWDKPKNS